jgi:aarF domain-containing kinase
MSVEFNNAYQEILLDNLVAIIKQNFIFQTQIKILESSGKNKEDLQKKFEDLTTLYNNAKSEISQLQVYKSKAEQNSSAHEEKSRIQTALNEEMKKSSNLQKEVENLKQQIVKSKDEHNKEVENLKQQIVKSKDEHNKEVENLKQQIVKKVEEKTSEYSNQIENFKQQLSKKNDENLLEVKKLNDYIKQLEENLAPTKLKKIKEPVSEVFEQKMQTPKIENKIQKVLDGNTF